MNVMDMARLSYKMEAVLTCCWEIVKKMKMFVGDSTIQSKRTIRYLGLIIDDILSFKHHVKFANRKTAVTHIALASMLAGRTL